MGFIKWHLMDIYTMLATYFQLNRCVSKFNLVLIKETFTSGCVNFFLSVF